MYDESSDITFDLERSNSRSLRSLISCKGAELRHTLLLNINRKAYIGGQFMQIYLTSDFESLYL